MKITVKSAKITAVFKKYQNSWQIHSHSSFKEHCTEEHLTVGRFDLIFIWPAQDK